MRRSSVHPILSIVLVLAASAACSKSTPGSPVAPSASSTTSTSAPTPASTGASISGMVVTGSPAALASSIPVAIQGVGGAGRVTVSVNGTSITTISDDRGSFTLQNVPPGSVTLTITGNGFSAPVTLPTVNTNDQLTVTVRINGNSATLDDQELESPDDKAEIEGQITAVNGNTITVGRLAKQVVVPPSASITKGGATRPFSDLVVGLRVHVRATRSGSTLTATTVIIQTDNPGGSDRSSNDDSSKETDTNEVSFSGSLAAAPSGSCPAISFTVGSTKVKTSASTKFDNATCTTFLSLASGTAVKGEGVKQSDGSVLASEVEAQSSSGGGSGKNGK